MGQKLNLIMDLRLKLYDYELFSASYLFILNIISIMTMGDKGITNMLAIGLLVMVVLGISLITYMIGV